MRISDWSSDVCSSDLDDRLFGAQAQIHLVRKQYGGAARLDARRRERRHPRNRSGRRQQSGPPAMVARRQMALFHGARSEEHTSELQSLMRKSYADSCLKQTHKHSKITLHNTIT